MRWVCKYKCCECKGDKYHTGLGGKEKKPTENICACHAKIQATLRQLIQSACFSRLGLFQFIVCIFYIKWPAKCHEEVNREYRNQSRWWMRCRLDCLFKSFPQRLSLTDCRQHFVTIIRRGQRWQEFNGQIRVIERCWVWQYFWTLNQKAFISDQQHSELSLNYQFLWFFCLFVFLFKVRIISRCIPESSFSSSQFPCRTFLLKERWILPVPSHAT